VESNLRIRLSGGLGNQLFKSLVGLNFSMLTSSIPSLDLTWYGMSRKTGELVSNRKFELDYFSDLHEKFIVDPNLRFPRIDWKLGQFARRFNSKAMARLGYFTDKNIMSIKKGQRRYILDGSFENWSLLPNTTLLKELLEFPNQKSDWLESVQGRFLKSEFVGIHIRRGDYLNLPHIYDVLSPSYYQRALQEMEDVVGDLPRVLFSDDPTGAIGWLDQRIKFDEVVRPPKEVPTGDVLQLMSKSTGLVAAHSTFSWWAARIGTINGTTRHVIIPNRFFKEESLLENDLLVPGWTALEV
jgi:hypothetical protein